MNEISSMTVHKNIINGFSKGLDESLSMKSRLLKRISLAYGHSKYICGCYGLQQAAKHPFTYSLDKKIRGFLFLFWAFNHIENGVHAICLPSPVIFFSILWC